VNSDLQKYIQQARFVGKNDEIIRAELKTGGWTEIDITQALNSSLVTAQPSKRSTTQPFLIIFGLSLVPILIIKFTSLKGIPMVFLMVLVFAGIPWALYKTTSRKDESYSGFDTKQDKITKILLKIYIVFFIWSLMNAFGSIFVFDGEDMLNLRYGIFWSAISLPPTILLACFFSKKSLKWFLLPILPLVIFLYFNFAFSSYGRKSDEEYFKNNHNIEVDPYGGVKLKF
jgi:hypothetical protein